MRRLRLTGVPLTAFLLTTSTSLFGADNKLTSQEKAQGWILLFDGKTLNGWEALAAAPAAANAPVPTWPQVGRNPRACSSPAGKAAVPERVSHWEVVKGSSIPAGSRRAI